ncbi:MAG TPA: selenide, water dikinase SelD, partial [Campylobacterales bacterium]|nr:selenide, water dikinase SelD [Campylobacterales bacterium]
TDITGFGLLGHAMEMAGNTVTISLHKSTVPIFEEVKQLALDGVIPGGSKSNQKYLEDRVQFKVAKDILLFDAQTSGGLLISVSQTDAPQLLQRLKNEGYEYSAIIGEVRPKAAHPIVVT